MITVFKGDQKIICTKSTYEKQLKHLGYQIASKKEEAIEEIASFKQEENIKKEDKQDDEYEKISEKYKIDKKTTSKKRK